MYTLRSQCWMRLFPWFSNTVVRYLLGSIPYCLQRGTIWFCWTRCVFRFPPFLSHCTNLWYFFQYYGYSLPKIVGSAIKDTGQCGNSLKDLHPINIGANIYGVASCFAFLRLIWIFELHHRIGPILFCIKVIIVCHRTIPYIFCTPRFIFICPKNSITSQCLEMNPNVW